MDSNDLITKQGILDIFNPDIVADAVQILQTWSNSEEDIVLRFILDLEELKKLVTKQSSADYDLTVNPDIQLDPLGVRYSWEELLEALQVLQIWCRCQPELSARFWACLAGLEWTLRGHASEGQPESAEAPPPPPSLKTADRVVHVLPAAPLAPRGPRNSAGLHRPPPPPLATCLFCQKTFHGVHHLRQHLRIHTGEMPYRCSECGRRFRQLSHLQQHGRSVHTGERPYLCRLCGGGGRRFLQLSHLKQHLRLHTGERPYKCPQCEAAFRQLSCLRSHVARVHKVVTTAAVTTVSANLTLQLDHGLPHDHKPIFFLKNSQNKAE